MERMLLQNLSLPLIPANQEKVFNEASFVVTASEHVKRLLVIRGCRRKKNKGNPLRDRNREVKTNGNGSKGSKVTLSLIFLGRLTEKKNPLALIHAFKLVVQQIPEAKLSIIGTGKLENEIKNRIEQLGLTNSVRLLGSMPQSEALKVVNQHWLFTQHNVTAVDGDQEGYSLAPAEAACIGTPGSLHLTQWYTGACNRWAHRILGQGVRL